MKNLLTDKVALITGAASGIGRASSIAMADEGAMVVVADRDESGGEAVVAEIVARDGKAVFVPMDVASRQSVSQGFDQVIAQFGRLDCAFNNAGVAGGNRLIAETTDEEWDRLIGINITGVWSCMRREIQEMLPHGGGTIVNTASVAGLVGWRAGAVYSATKHAVVGLTRSAALDYARQGMRINAVCPGVIQTPMSAALETDTSGVRERLIRRHPQGRFGQAEEIAAAVVWLCSDQSSFTNGHMLAVDGGYTAQ
ncbi:MAG: NAD(P)-dependent dehydrogenase (short-subunit alcohol dehydrogenase family) [Gammaproteobacteria bacterium]|jgi:NAD(P)-dependent dehydrogenase (short-subunit alcohol dehydrogenase family)